MAEAADALDPALGRFLAGAGLGIDPGRARATPLTGGVASDIWRVEDGARVCVVKRALARLRVPREWTAPVSRNAAEVAWLRAAAAIVPDAVPPVLAHDARLGMFAMPYYDPLSYPVWKAMLRDGIADPAVAARLGAVLAAIHAATADRPEVAGEFDHAETFRAIRIEPYFGAAARVHPDLRPFLDRLSIDTLACRRALVHGDVSPKNILVGPGGPMLLDAECACYGDPAFDAAFCLSHLLLKSVWRPASADGLAACFMALARAYLAGVSWEVSGDVEARVVRLLPALLLARVDGKSPVEYLDPNQQARVRAAAPRLIARPPEGLSALLRCWRRGAP